MVKFIIFHLILKCLQPSNTSETNFICIQAQFVEKDASARVPEASRAVQCESEEGLSLVQTQRVERLRRARRSKSWRKVV